MFWILIFSLLGLSVIAAYRSFKLLNWTVGMALILVGFAVFTDVSMLAIVALSVLFAAVAIPLNFKPLRRQWLSAPFLTIYRKMLPTLSETEKIALEAGTVGWEGELFAGNPDWDSLLDQHWPELSDAEQAYVDGPVEELCQMLDPWKISHELADPPEVDGKVIARPTAKSSISIRQPWPAISIPPTRASSGTNTSLPRIGPLWNGTFNGK